MGMKMINPDYDQVEALQCLERNEGVIGCGSYVGAIFLFSLTSRGVTNWNYNIYSNGYTICFGLTKESSKIYMILSSMGSEFSLSGYLSPTILEFEASTGSLKRSKAILFYSSVSLANNLRKIKDGPFVFAGSSKGVKRQNY